MPSFISHAKAFAVLLTSVSHLQGQYLPGSGCQVKWTCVEATTPSPPGVPAQALDVVCISAVAVSKVQGLSPIKCSIAKQNPTDQPTTGLETCGEKRLEEQLGVLGFTSTLNENVKQIIHLLARGTIFLGNENRKNKPCNRSPSSSHRPSSLLPLSGRQTCRAHWPVLGLPEPTPPLLGRVLTCCWEQPIPQGLWDPPRLAPAHHYPLAGLRTERTVGAQPAA